MNMKNRSIRLLRCLLVLMLIACTSVCLVLSVSAAAVWQVDPPAGEYTVGDTFTVPRATVTAGAKTVEADSLVVFPDGSATKSKTFTLTMYGKYTISYTAVVGGNVYAKDVSFSVSGQVATVSSAKSSITYGKYRYAKTASGLMVRLAEGDTLRFSQAIDVSAVTKNDVLIECFATPDTKGNVDFEKLVFTFTDSENPDIYLRFFARQSSESYGYPITYYLAGGNGQPMVGWEEWWKRLHIDNEWGTQARHSFSLAFDAQFPEVAPDEMPINLRYDVETNSAYVSSLMISDFDNPSFYNKLWRGFPSGKVFLSIQGAMYTNETANFCVSYVKDTNLKAESFSDTTGPVITVDTPYTSMPDAQVGSPYRVPSAVAVDTYSGKTDVTVSVWYNYFSSNAVLSQIRDGAFVPTKAGTYVIEYLSEDFSGNVSRKLLYVNAGTDTAAPVITLTKTPETTATAGNTLIPAPYTVTSSADSAAVTVEAILNGKRYDAKNGIRLTETGTCEIVYTATDYIGKTTVYSYTVTVVAAEQPLFFDEPDLPLFFISGNGYSLPDFYAYDYSSGKETKIAATLTVTDGNGTVTVGSGKMFVPQVSENGQTVRLTYTVGDVTLTREIPTIIEFVDENGRERLKLENYIRSNGLTVLKEEDYMTLTATTADGTWIFANSLVAKNAELVFSGVQGKSSYESITVFFVDANDINNVICATFLRSSNETKVIVDGQTTILTQTFNAEDKFTITYDGDGGFVINNAQIPVTKRLDGKAFEGFAGKVYVGTIFAGARKGNQMRLYSVDGHPMRISASDRVAPKIAIMGDYGGSYKPGDVVTLPAAQAGDALEPNVIFTMTVLDSHGNVVVDTSGRRLSNVDPTREYTIVLSSIGQYSVMYTAKEATLARPNTAPFTYALNVEDTEAPTFDFAHLFPETVRVGENIILPDFTVSDDTTAPEDIAVFRYIVTPDGRLVQIPENSNALVATVSGVYEIRIVARDKSGNASIIRRYVTVTQ